MRLAPLILAAAAVVHATAVVQPNAIFATGPGTGTVTGNAAAPAPTATYTPTNSGQGLEFQGTATVNSGQTVIFSYSGTGSGTLEPGLNASWSFSIGGPTIVPSVISQDSGIAPYTLQFGINGQTTSSSGTALYGSTNGSTTLDYTSGVALTGWSASFSFTDNDPSGNPISIDFFDPIFINPPRTMPGSVAEPASLLLMVPGFGLLVLRKRRCRLAV